MSALIRIVCALVATSALFSAETSSSRLYRIGMCPWIAWSPMHVAEAQGLWKKLGVDVQVINQLGEEEHTVALEQHHVDFTMDMIGNFVGMQQNGTSITILAELDWSHGGDKVIAKNKDQPTKKGDTIGIYHHDPAVLMLLHKYLASIQLQLSDVTVVEYDPEALSGHFMTEKFSTIISYDPYTTQTEKEGGIVVATTASYPGCMPEGLAARSDILAEIPHDDLVKILSGWVAGVKWIDDEKNWNAYVDILNDRTFAEPDPYTGDEFRAMLKNVRIHEPATLLERNAPGGGLEIFLDECHRMLVENKMLKKEYKAAEMVNTSVIREIVGKAR
jgi:NitT/TauT family transport system substrate-binding protein